MDFILLPVVSLIAFTLIIFLVRRRYLKRFRDIQADYIYKCLQKELVIWRLTPTPQVATSMAKPFARIHQDGKSDSVWLKTNDSKFLIKSLRNHEFVDLMVFLPSLQNHIRRYPDSLLPRIHAIFSVQNTSFIVIENIFPGKITAKFDFKGSNLDRQANQHPVEQASASSSSHTASSSHDISSSITYKELDFDRMYNEGLISFIHVGATCKTLLSRQLNLDVTLLREHGFIDYSLLVGVLNVPKRALRKKLSIPHIMSNVGERVTRVLSMAFEQQLEYDLEKQALLQPYTPFYKTFNGGLRSDGLESESVHYQVYYFGIIDILTKFSFMKRIERGLKKHFSISSNIGKQVTTRSISSTQSSAKKQRSSFEIGAVEPSVEEPTRYATRLIEFVEKILV